MHCSDRSGDPKGAGHAEWAACSRREPATDAIDRFKQTLHAEDAVPDATRIATKTYSYDQQKQQIEDS
jgi:hypothetical protein